MVYPYRKRLAVSLSLALFLSVAIVFGQEKGREYHVPEGCECIELFAEGSMEKEMTYVIREFGRQIPFLITGPIAIPLTGYIDGVVFLAVDMPYTDIRWLDMLCFVSGEGGIYYCENSGERHLIVGTEGMITSFCLSEEGIFFTEKDCLLFKPFSDGEVKALICADEAIGPVSVADNVCFFGVGKEIFAIQGPSMAKIYSAQSEVLTLAAHPDGSVFFGTNSGVYCITPDLKEAEIVSSPARSLDIVGSNLFLSFIDASCVMITNITLFS